MSQKNSWKCCGWSNKCLRNIWMVPKDGPQCTHASHFRFRWFDKFTSKRGRTLYWHSTFSPGQLTPVGGENLTSPFVTNLLEFEMGTNSKILLLADCFDPLGLLCCFFHLFFVSLPCPLSLQHHYLQDIRKHDNCNNRVWKYQMPAQRKRTFFDWRIPR